MNHYYVKEVDFTYLSAFGYKLDTANSILDLFVPDKTQIRYVFGFRHGIAESHTISKF